MAINTNCGDQNLRLIKVGL